MDENLSDLLQRTKELQQRSDELDQRVEDLQQRIEFARSEDRAYVWTNEDNQLIGLQRELMEEWRKNF